MMQVFDTKSFLVYSRKVSRDYRIYFSCVFSNYLVESAMVCMPEIFLRSWY